jgi:energy-converting hydrogenase Eha subunit A
MMIHWKAGLLICLLAGIVVGALTAAVIGYFCILRHRTARTDFPYAALLPTSRQGLWDLSCGAHFQARPHDTR